MRRRPSPRTLVWSTVLVLAALWLGLWVGVPLTAPSPPPLCARVPGVARGLYHVHPVGHDDVDRSDRLLRAAREMCLDFVVVTNHNGLDAELLRTPPDDILVLDGSEWTVDSVHLGQLAGAIHHADSVSDDAQRLRVLNHPWASGVHNTSDLAAAVDALLAHDDLAWEVINGTRFFPRAPSMSARFLSLAAGLGRPDLFFAALSLPGPALQTWVRLQEEVGRPVPMICGSDAHGNLTDYREVAPATLIQVDLEGAALSAESLVDAVRARRVTCVNEHLGSPGRVALREVTRDAGCPPTGGAVRVDVRVGANLIGGAQWRILRGGTEVVARGDASRSVRLEEVGVYHLELWRPVTLGVLGEFERLWAVAGAVVIPACSPEQGSP